MDTASYCFGELEIGFPKGLVPSVSKCPINNRRLRIRLGRYASPGDMKGLHKNRMMRSPRAQQVRAERAKLLQDRNRIERMLDKYEHLPPELQRIITEEVNRLVAEQTTKEPEPA
jgi:hypothetical protein